MENLKSGVGKNLVIAALATLVGAGIAYEGLKHHDEPKEKPEAKQQPQLVLNPTVQQQPAPVVQQPAYQTQPLVSPPQQPIAAAPATMAGVLTPEQARVLPVGTPCTVQFRSAGGVSLKNIQLVNYKPYRKGAVDPQQFTVVIPVEVAKVAASATKGRLVTASGVIDEYGGQPQLKVETATGFQVQ